MHPLYHRPAGGRTGDPIPFFHDGTWHVFYLNYRAERFNHTPPGARRTPWSHISSRDLDTWTCLPDAITPGDENALDAGSCATGSVVEIDGTFHLYYTGRSFTRSGERREVICRAVSDDLIHWEKGADTAISTPDHRRYNLGHWRDPFVLWNPEEETYWMIVTAELRHAPTGRGGCLALLISADLQHWEPAGELLAPYGTTIPECPDLFQWNGWWYLLYSADGRTRYRRARTLSGPWLNARYDAFDDRFFYAAKSAGDDGRRLLFGWVGDKDSGRDDGRLQWGGELVVRELVQDDDGYLVAGQPGELYLAGASPSSVLAARLGNWAELPEGACYRSPQGFGYATTSPVSADLQLQLTIRASRSTRSCGVVIRTTDDLAGGCMVNLDLTEHQLKLGSIDPRTGRLENILSRPLPPFDGDLDVRLTATDSVVDVAVGNRSTLVGRFSDSRGMTLALFADGGPTEFDHVRLSSLTTAPDGPGATADSH